MTYSLIECAMADGVVMRVRRFEGGAKKPVLCIPGLTRNASDFDDIAPLVAAGGRDVIAVSLRGRGPSDRDADYRRYRPQTYRDDLLHLLNQLGITAPIWIGTSLGAIIIMLCAEAAPHRIGAAILNDAGAEIAPEGVERIGVYLSANQDQPTAPTLEEAARRLKAANHVAHPTADDQFWRTFAKRAFRRTETGAWTPDYDPAISRALTENGPAPDLWPGWKSLNDKPTLVIRGALSDLLTPPIVDEMRAARPGFDYAEIAGVGHAPLLSEPDSIAAIENFLANID